MKTDDRVARVLGGPHTRKERERVAAYMPGNYRAELHLDPAIGGDGAMSVFVIGRDVAGWTMDDYVLPRLASGLIWAEEVVK